MALQCRHLVMHAPNWLGDVIMAQPAMHTFAMKSGAGRISITGRPWLADILPWLDLPGADYLPEGAKGGDVRVLFPNNFRSAWLALQSGAKRRIGYRGQWRSLLLSDPLRPRISMLSGHHRDYYNDLATQMGLDVGQPEVKLSFPAGAVDQGAALLHDFGLDAELTLCMAPGAQFGGAKRYPAESWAEVARQLSQCGYHILTLGTPAEREIADQVLADCVNPAFNSAGSTTLSECLQLLAASRGLLSNDSGLMHVAAGLGKRVVAVFGATDPARTAPSGPQVQLFYHPAKCSPCLRRECNVAGQPCMANTLPEELVEAALELLR